MFTRFSYCPPLGGKCQGSSWGGSVRTFALYCALGAVICVSTHFMFDSLALLKQAELNTLDLRYRLRPDIHLSSQLATVDIDAAMIERAGSWPVSRKFYAEFMKVLRDYDARLLSLDILFPDPSPLTVPPDQMRAAMDLAEKGSDGTYDLLSRMARSGDDEMVEAMAETDLTILAQTFKTAGPGRSASRDNPPGEAQVSSTEPTNVAALRSLSLLHKYSLDLNVMAPGNENVPRAVSLEAPHARVLEKATGVGFAQVFQDVDGTVRRYPLFIHYNGRLYPSLAMMGFAIVTGVPLDRIEITPGKCVLLPGANLKDEKGRRSNLDIRIPVDRSLKMITNWAGDYLDTFTHFPGNLLLQFRGVDLIRQRVHEYAERPGELIEKGFAAISAEIVGRRLMGETEAELAVRDLLLAQLAESALIDGSLTKPEFLDAYSPADDVDTRQLLSAIWDQVAANQHALQRLKIDPDEEYDKLKQELEIPDERDSVQRHSVEFLRFIVKQGKDPGRWRPLYFFPQVSVSSEGRDTKFQLSPLDLTGKIFYGGLTATGTHDFNPMPFSPRYPMVGLHVNAANTMLTRQFIRTLPGWAELLIVMGFTLLVACLSLRLHPVAGTGLAVLLAGAYVWFAQSAFSRAGLFVPVMTPLVSAAAVYLVIVLRNFMREQREKKKIRSAFSTYMTPAVVNQVLKNPDMLRLGGERRTMSVFFSDLSGFTSISERSSPEELVALLNEYLESMTKIIFSNEGTLDKYQGDGIMAFWNAPIYEDDHAYLCCCAALESVDHLENVLKPKWSSEGRPVLDVRIGINTGPMIVGNMGSDTRMDYTVMGDAVNLGSRLEPANKEYGTRIMMSEYTRELVAGRIMDRELDIVRVKGKKKPVRVYEVLCRSGESSPEQEELWKLYSEGLSHYRERRWQEGIKAFSAALAIDGNDRPSSTYLQRSREYLTNPPPQDWDGTFSVGK